MNNTIPTILIIEDDDFLRSLTVTKLEKEGFHVEMAVNGTNGLEKIQTTHPSLILLDLMLPGIDGFEILSQMNDRGPITTPIIIFSNLGSEEDIRRVQQYGVTEYLIKSSFTLDELVEKIKKILTPEK